MRLFFHLGLYSYTPAAWLHYVYPKLKPADKPMECIQNAGEIFYVVCRHDDGQ